MKIKEVMDQFQVTRKALLIYENKELIHPSRDESGYRTYSAKDIEAIKQIVLLRKMEFSLEEIEAIVLQHNYDVIESKKKVYEKDKHFIETKTSYLDYVSQTFKGEHHIDETLNAMNETIQLYEKNHHNDMVQFDYHRDTIGVMWVASFIIALLSGQGYLIIGSLLMGLVGVLLSLKSFRQFCLTKRFKGILGVILVIIGIVGLLLFITKEDTFVNCMVTAMSVISILAGGQYISPVKDFVMKYRAIFGIVSLLVGISIFATGTFYNWEGLIGFTMIYTAIILIGFGLIHNKWLRKWMIFLIRDVFVFF